MFLNPWYGTAAPAAPAAVESGGEDINQLDQPVSGSSTSSSAESTTSTASTASVTSHVIPPLDAIQKRLKKGWTVHVNREGRLFYCNHSNQTSSWLPPLDNWDGHGGGSVAETPPLPYGWEAALDREGKPYFINHLNKTTTYEDPRKDWTEDPPQPRHVELARHPELGFGFVAGSERPVIVRFVTEGGPSVEKLLPGDQILEINGEDVRNAPRDHVIQLVRSCKDSVQLTVCQPPLDNSARKSAILSAAKKAKLKSNPSRVRFAEGVVINGTPLSMMRRDQGDQALPFLPNVMKVYLENGQTKSFKYDSATTVADVLVSLQQKLSFKSMDHFSLCVEHVKSLRRNKLTLLDSTESLARIAARPGAHNLRCLLRVAFVPKDAYELLRKDTGAFEYLFMQCCNDVVQERFAPELKYDIALRLAALHIQQHAVSNKMQGKVTVKNVEREFGLERFVPASLVEAMKRKELRKLLSHFLKANQNLVASGQKHLTALQAKLHYLKIIADLPSYGAKCFSTSFSDSNIESVILISPKYAISRITGLRNSTPLALCDIEDVTSVALRREDELTQHLEIRLKDPDKETIVLSLEERDADELVLVLRGYYKLLTDRALLIHRERNRWTDDAAPPYPTRHCVESAQWSFLDHTGDHAVTDTEASKILKFVDLSTPPPYHPPPEGFQIHQNFGVTQDFEDDQASDMDSCKGVQLDLSPQVNRARLDRNMNKPLPNNNIESNTSSGQCNVTNSAVNVGQELGFDVPSILSMEILESERGCPEARNDAILRRVSDMRRLVEESEQYLISDSDDPKPILKDVDSASLLSDLSRTESDVSSGPPYGQLRHSDSLLLLTQGQKQLLDIPTDGFPEAVPVEAPDSEGHDPSGSDTDSLNTPNATPTHSPSQRPKAVDRNARPVSMLKPSDSSFGLHSPDVIPALKGDDSEMQDLLKRLQEDHTLPYPFAEGTLYLDPDIIDLTMIPPPITPEEEGLKMMPTTLSAPPTPFADRLSLEVELQGSGMIARLPALPEMGDLGDLRDLNDLSQWSEIHSDTSSGSRGIGSSSALNTSSEVDDTLSMSSFSNSVTSRDSFTSPSPSPSNTDSTASSRKTLSSQWSVDNSADNDLDSFLAAVAFPPPPQSSNKPITSKTAATESAFKLDSMNSEDLSAFIIPPPPSNLQEEGGKGLEALQKLYQAREGIDQVMSQDSDGSCSDIDFGEKDRTVYELKLGSEMRTGPNKEKIGPKIAQLQKQFAMSARKESSDGSSGYGSVKSDAESSSDTPDIPARMPASPKKSFLMNALKPPTTIIKVPNKSNLGTVTVTNKLTPAPSPKPSLLSTLQKQHSLPSHPVFDHFHYHVCEDDDIPPPPPPPRNPIPRHAYTLQKPSASSTKTPSLARSSSQTELCSSLPEAPPALAPKQILKPGPVLPVHGKRSASSDSILSPRVSPSPSKWSMTSSSDSLASSASIATVKAAPGVGANEDTPPLPPRNTLPRDKPPLPNDSGKFASKSARSPSPQEKPDGSRPPVLPSRLKKPSTTTPAPPVASKVTITKPVPKLSPNGYGKPAAPSPTQKTSFIPVYASPPNNSAIPRPGSASSSPSKRALTTVNNKTVHSGTQSGLRPQTHQSPIRKPIAWAESDTESPIASITKKPPLVEPEDMQITLESPSSPQSSPLTNGAFYSVGQSRLPRAASTSSPLHTRSPKLSPKPVPNGIVHTYKAEDPKMWYVNNASESQHSPNSRDDSNSVDSGSFENDSLDSSTELDIKLQCLQAEGIITRILSRLSMPGATLSDDEVLKTDVILAAKDRLAQESRQFVTASKLFVKSTTESPQTMATCLIQCVTLVERMAEASSQMPVTIQGQDLNAKVKDVARAFHHTIKAASEAAGHGVNEPAMGRLMGKATALASVLTVLMRSLRPGA